MQFTRALVLLVCASYTLAITCGNCAHNIKTVPLSNKCYRANALKGGQPETVCTYEEENGVPMGISCTYDKWGKINRSASAGGCAEVVPVNSDSCPPCLV